MKANDFCSQAESETWDLKYEAKQSMIGWLDDYVAPATEEPPPLHEHTNGGARYPDPDAADTPIQDSLSKESDSDGESDDEEELMHIQCWVPGKRLEATVLAVYLEYFIDDSAPIRQSRSPHDDRKTGFAISAQAAMSIGELRDMLKDSESWNAEMTGREYRNDPYSYHESDTWWRRKQAGPTIHHRCPHPRQRKMTSVSEPLLSARSTASQHDRYQDSRYVYS